MAKKKIKKSKEKATQEMLGRVVVTSADPRTSLEIDMYFDKLDARLNGARAVRTVRPEHIKAVFGCVL